MARDNSPLKHKFKRQMIYAGGTLIAIVISYLTVFSFLDKSPKEEYVSPIANSPEAWYKSQSLPPEMIITPDLPMFADELHQVGEEKTKSEARAYKKALPRWQKFAVATTPIGNKPLIAIVIDDMGIDSKRSAIAIGLKAPLTLSFLTYAKDLEGQTKRASIRGHELLLHVSMEPSSPEVDPGPNALLINLSEQEIRRRLDWGFSRFSSYVGLNNHMGSKFTSDSKAMRIVLEETKRRGLLFLDSRTSGKTVGAKLARELGVPVVERDVFLDHENNISAINAQLEQVEKIARRMGAVVAIGHPRDATIEALKIWLKTIESKGFQLVPLTTIVKKIGQS